MSVETQRLVELGNQMEPLAPDVDMVLVIPAMMRDKKEITLWINQLGDLLTQRRTSPKTQTLYCVNNIAEDVDNDTEAYQCNQFMISCIDYIQGKRDTIPENIALDIDEREVVEQARKEALDVIALDLSSQGKAIQMKAVLLEAYGGDPPDYASNEDIDMPSYVRMIAMQVAKERFLHTTAGDGFLVYMDADTRLTDPLATRIIWEQMIANNLPAANLRRDFMPYGEEEIFATFYLAEFNRLAAELQDHLNAQGTWKVMRASAFHPIEHMTHAIGETFDEMNAIGLESFFIIGGGIVTVDRQSETGGNTSHLRMLLLKSLQERGAMIPGPLANNSELSSVLKRYAFLQGIHNSLVWPILEAYFNGENIQRSLVSFADYAAICEIVLKKCAKPEEEALLFACITDALQQGEIMHEQQRSLYIKAMHHFLHPEEMQIIPRHLKQFFDQQQWMADEIAAYMHQHKDATEEDVLLMFQEMYGEFFNAFHKTEFIPIISKMRGMIRFCEIVINNPTVYTNFYDLITHHTHPTHPANDRALRTAQANRNNK